MFGLLYAGAGIGDFAQGENMSREERFRELGKHAYPDHRFLPESVLKRIENLPKSPKIHQQGTWVGMDSCGSG